MSDLQHKYETKVTSDSNGIITSITNVSNDVFLDTKPLNGTSILSSDFFKDSTEYLILSKGESFKFTLNLTKESYHYEDFKHIDTNPNFFRVSIKNNSGNYETIYNFYNEADYPHLQNLIYIGDVEQKGDEYETYVEFSDGFKLLEELGKNYVYNTNDIKIEISDKAGHIFTCFNTIPIYTFPFDLDDLLPLEITFEEQNPSQRYIGDGSIGSVVAIIHNPDNSGEKPSADVLRIDKYLAETSVGKIIKYECTYFYYDENGVRKYVEDPEQIVEVREKTGIKDLNKYEWLYVKIDNIVRTGYVQLFANLVFNNDLMEGATDQKALDYIEKRVKNATTAYATDGEWVTYCPNNRKINLEPFVPMYLKESQYFEFVKFTEDFLNTMFYSNDYNCKLGVLAKIHDLGNMHDVERLDRIFLNDFAKNFGSTIKINEENLVNLLTIFGDKSKTSYDEKDITNYIREAYRILPYYNKIKGTDESIKLMLSTFGCTCEIIYKWLSKIDGEDDLYENIDDKADRDKYYLSSHFNIDLGIKNYRIEEYVEIIKPVRELVFSIKPLSRVFDAFEYTISTDYDINLDFTKSVLSVDNRLGDKTDIYDKYIDENLKEYEFFKSNCVVKTNADEQHLIYEFEFIDNMSRVGLDNFDIFFANNGKCLRVYLEEKLYTINFLNVTYVDGKMYLFTNNDNAMLNGTCYIKCRKIKNANIYINC